MKVTILKGKVELSPPLAYTSNAICVRARYHHIKCTIFFSSNDSQHIIIAMCFASSKVVLDGNEPSSCAILEPPLAYFRLILHSQRNSHRTVFITADLTNLKTKHLRNVGLDITGDSELRI